MQWHGVGVEHSVSAATMFPSVTTYTLPIQVVFASSASFFFQDFNFFLYSRSLKCFLHIAS